jgi:hypothetical protein
LCIESGVEIDLRSSCSNHAKDRLIHVPVRTVHGRTILVRIVAVSKALRNFHGGLVTLLSPLGQLSGHTLLQILVGSHVALLWFGRSNDECAGGQLKVADVRVYYLIALV